MKEVQLSHSLDKSGIAVYFNGHIKGQYGGNVSVFQAVFRDQTMEVAYNAGYELEEISEMWKTYNKFMSSVKKEVSEMTEDLELQLKRARALEKIFG